MDQPEADLRGSATVSQVVADEPPCGAAAVVSQVTVATIRSVAQTGWQSALSAPRALPSVFSGGQIPVEPGAD